jgi:hypothetical protein
MRHPPIIDTLRFAVVLLCSVACDAGGNGAAGELADAGPDDQSTFPVDGDEDAGAPCLRACERYEQACMRDEGCSILCSEYRKSFVGCEAEFDDTYECFATEPKPVFDCTQDSFLLHRPAACEALNVTLHRCRRTGGAPCKTEPALDESCAIRPETERPRWLFCREGMDPPAGCESHLQLEEPLGYCCPEESVAEFE